MILFTCQLSAISDKHPTEPPLIADVGGPYFGMANEEILFDASNSYGKKILNYIWDFGDGTTDDGVDPTTTHKYLEIGVYHVTLTMITKYGSVVNTTKAIITERNVERDATWTKKLVDGKWILKSYSGLINYNDNGIWKPINIRLERDNNKNLVVNEAPYRLEISADKSSYRIYPDRNINDKYIDFYMPDLKVPVQLKFGVLQFKDFFKFRSSLDINQQSLTWNLDNFKIKIIPTNSMVSFEYILKNEKALNEISMRIVPHNCVISPNGCIERGKYQLVNLVYDNNINITQPICKYDIETNMLNIEINTTGLEYPIILDPTLQIQAAEYDGWIYNDDAVYNDSHNATSGYLYNQYVWSRVGQIINKIYRSYLYFDTSVIEPSTFPLITNANISLYGKIKSSVFTIVTQINATGERPSIPLLATDFNYAYYEGDLGSLYTLGFTVNTWNKIPLNLSGLENITTGWTKFCLRSDYDIDFEMNGVRYIDYYNCRSSLIPYLTIEWSGPEITNEYPDNQSINIPRYINHSIDVTDSSGKNMWIRWYWRPHIYTSWKLFGENNSVNNGTYQQNNSVNYTYYNYKYEWRVIINNTDNVWMNETYYFYTINSSAPIISNISPLNGTIFTYKESEENIYLSVQVNDSEGGYMKVTMYMYNDFTDSIVSVYEQSGFNQTHTATLQPYLAYVQNPGVKYWFIEVTEYNYIFYPTIYVDNVVYSDLYWFSVKEVWKDDFLGNIIDIDSTKTNFPLHIFNLINYTNYTNYVSPVRESGRNHPLLYDDDSHVEFRQYMNNTVSGGISASQDVILTRATIGQTSSSNIVFLNDTYGYAVNIKFMLPNNRLTVMETNDGGDTWSYVTDTTQYHNIFNVGIWFDGWTSGNYEDKIHLIFISKVNVLEYRLIYGYFNTLTKTLTIDYSNILHKFNYGPNFVYDSRPSICVSTDGNIFISAWGGYTNYDYYRHHGVVMRSSDSGETWTEITPINNGGGVTPYLYFRNITDQRFVSCIIIPHGENNISLIHHYKSSLYNCVYNKSNGSWSSSVVVGSCFRFSIHHHATYWKKTGDIYLTWLTRQKSATASVEFIQYNLSNKTWWGQRTIESNVYGMDSNIIISEGNGDLYIFYGNSSYLNIEKMNISCRNSTNHGNIWGSSQPLNSDPPQWASYTYGNFMSEHRIYGSWSDYAWDYWRGRSIREYNETHSYKNTGNLSSVKITLPNEYFSWSNFSANYTTNNNGVNFEIRNKTGAILFNGLDGNNNDISSINTSVEDNRTIFLFMNFTNTSKVDWWDINFVFNERFYHWYDFQKKYRFDCNDQMNTDFKLVLSNKNRLKFKITLELHTTDDIEYQITLRIDNFEYCRERDTSLIFVYDNYIVVYDYEDMRHLETQNIIDNERKIFYQIISLHIEPSHSDTFIIDPSFLIVTSPFVETNWNQQREIAVTSNCTFHTGYTEIVPGNPPKIWHAISYDLGKTWSTTQISTNVGTVYEYYPVVCVTSNDTVYFLWNTIDVSAFPSINDNLRFRRYYSDSNSYSPIRTFNDVHRHLMSHSGCIDKNDTFHITAMSHEYTGVVISQYYIYYGTIQPSDISPSFSEYPYQQAEYMSYPTIEVNNSNIPYITFTAENQTWWTDQDQIRLIYLQPDSTWLSPPDNVSDYTQFNKTQSLSSMCFRRNDTLCITWQGGTTVALPKIRFRERFSNGNYGSIETLTGIRQKSPSITKEKNETLHIVFHGKTVLGTNVQILNQTNGVWSSSSVLINDPSHYPIAYYSQVKVPLKGLDIVYINTSYTEMFFYKSDGMVLDCMMCYSDTFIGNTGGTLLAIIGGSILCFGNLFYLICFRRKNNKCNLCRLIRRGKNVR